MKTESKKYFVKIPNDVKIFYSSLKKIVILLGPFSTRTLKLMVQLSINKFQNFVEVTPFPFFKILKNCYKKNKAIQGTTVSLLKQLITEISMIFYQKLKFIGVGYRVFSSDTFPGQLLFFKLGYSHFIYFKIPSKVNIYCLKMTRLFIYGHSYQAISQISSLIRSYKKPEPYKGKGILYNTEKIKLKEGKKT